MAEAPVMMVAEFELAYAACARGCDDLARAGRLGARDVGRNPADIEAVSATDIYRVGEINMHAVRGHMAGRTRRRFRQVVTGAPHR